MARHHTIRSQESEGVMSVHVVTGAFGYSGKYIAARLLDEGDTVRTLTDSPNRSNPFGGRIKAEPFHFDEPAKLVAGRMSCQGKVESS